MHILYEYIGVKGLRVDASKHMWPGDLEAIQVKTVNSICIKQTPINFCFNEATHDYLLEKFSLEKV